MESNVNKFPMTHGQQRIIKHSRQIARSSGNCQQYLRASDNNYFLNKELSKDEQKSSRIFFIETEKKPFQNLAVCKQVASIEVVKQELALQKAIQLKIAAQKGIVQAKQTNCKYCDDYAAAMSGLIYVRGKLKQVGDAIRGMHVKVSRINNAFDYIKDASFQCDYTKPVSRTVIWYWHAYNLMIDTVNQLNTSVYKLQLNYDDMDNYINKMQRKGIDMMELVQYKESFIVGFDNIGSQVYALNGVIEAAREKEVFLYGQIGEEFIKMVCAVNDLRLTVSATFPILDKYLIKNNSISVVIRDVSKR